MSVSPLTSRRRRRGARALLLAGLATLLACGGDDGPTGSTPGDPIGGGPTPPTASPLVVSADSVRPNQLITLQPTGLGRAVPDTVTGQIGATPFRAARADDSTLVAIIPSGLSGTQTVRFVVHGREYTTQLVLGAPAPMPGDATATGTALFDRALLRLDTLDASLDSAGVAADTVALNGMLAAARTAIAAARDSFLLLSAEERAAAIPYIVAEAAAQGVYLDDASASRASGSDPAGLARRAVPNAAIRPLCTLVSSFDACTLLGATKSELSKGVQNLHRCAMNMGKGALYGAGLGGVAGGALGFLVGGAGAIPGAEGGALAGAKIGATVVLVFCVADAFESVRNTYVNTVKPVLMEATVDVDLRIARGGTRPNLSRGATADLDSFGASDAAVYTVGVARPVDVFVEFHSLSAADISGPPAVAELVALFNLFAQKWDAVRTHVPLVDLPAIALPASPRRVVRKRVPGNYLGVTSASPAPVAGSSAGTDQWTVTFSNPGQGDDHELSYEVRFSYPGFPDQQRTLTGVLQPSRYAVASLTVTPAADTILIERQTTLAWAASDSSGDLLSEAQLAGRAPTWTSASPTVAAVGSSTGVVTGAGAGTTTITAQLEQGRGTATVRVVRNIAGTYMLESLSGVAIPGTTYQDTVYVIQTTAGAVQLREDGTFSYSISATGTNVHTNITYDEGGSGGGTYRVSDDGSAFTFETTEQEGTPISFGTGFLSGDTLTVVVTTPDGSGTGILKKQ